MWPKSWVSMAQCVGPYLVLSLGIEPVPPAINKSTES